jgi:predicted dehydrogenase
MEEIRHFFKCVENDEEPYATGIDGREAVRVALGVVESIGTKQIVQVAR